MSAAELSAPIMISVSGEEREVTAATAAELFADNAKIVVTPREWHAGILLRFRTIRHR